MTLFDEEESPSTAAPGPPSIRVRMTVAYDGRGFRGFAMQQEVKTVGGELTAAMRKVLGYPVELTCAGRTDAGVHAWGQVVTFDARDDADLDALQRSLNKMLGPAIVVREAVVAAPDFDARRSALGRRYRYTVLNRPVPDPFQAGTAWHVEQPLDVRAMELACDPLIGEHDFSSFCRRMDENASMVRRVREACWIDLGDGILRFEIEASSFCQQMVRALVGTLVAVGTGTKKAGDMAFVLRSRDRSRAGQLAPPHGLCLWEVSY